MAFYINKTEGPSNHSNCTESPAADVQHFGDPLCASISISGLLLNTIVIFVILESMQQRTTQSQIHLIALAVSDLAVGVAYVCYAILVWTCDLTLLAQIYPNWIIVNMVV